MKSCKKNLTNAENKFLNARAELDSARAEISRLVKVIDELEEERENMQAEIELLTELQSRGAYRVAELGVENDELQKQVEELNEKIANLKSAMIDRVVAKSYDSLLTMPEDVEEIFGDAYESELNKFLEQAVKDTEKEILQGILSNCKAAKEKLDTMFVNKDSVYRIGYESAIDHYTDFIFAVARRKGVEVE